MPLNLMTSSFRHHCRDPGNNWVYAWRNPSSADSELPDGELNVVVWKNDRSVFHHYKDSKEDADISKNVTQTNYGVVAETFTLDTTFNSPLNKDGSGGKVQPAAGENVDEPASVHSPRLRRRANQRIRYRVDGRRCGRIGIIGRHR